MHGEGPEYVHTVRTRLQYQCLYKPFKYIQMGMFDPLKQLQLLRGLYSLVMEISTIMSVEKFEVQVWNFY